MLVAGGGSAGIAAAVAAARRGARVLLVEWHGTLGGMATAALVHSVCGLYLLRDEPGAVPANPGLATELAARLIAAGGAVAPVRMGRVDVLPHRPPVFALIADRMVGESRSVETWLHAAIVDVEAVAGRIERVVVSCRGERAEIEPAVVVDATGDASVAALAGAAVEIEPASRLQRPAYVVLLAGVAPDALDGERRLRVVHRITSGIRAGALPEAARGASLRATQEPGEAYVTIDLEPPRGATYDPLDPSCLAALEIHGRELAFAIADFLRAYVDGFDRCVIAALPARVGVRESRRVVGEHRIETDDIERGATFPDAVALATWPIELREQTTGPRLRYPRDARPTEIPLRALRARSVANLFVAGRCIAASHEAQASLRVIGTCLATGEAAGIAAALVAQDAAAARDTVALAALVRAGREHGALAEPSRTRTGGATGFSRPVASPGDRR